MPSLNKLFLRDSVTRNPALSRTARGTPACSFALQVDAADHARGIARAFIGPPAMLPDADSPAQTPEATSPARDFSFLHSAAHTNAM